MSKKKIILWNMGSLEHKIAPTKNAIELLVSMLKDNPEHIVWGPDLTATVVEGDVNVIVAHLGDGNKQITIVNN